MNGLRSSVAEFGRIVEGARNLAAVDLMICPPATLLVLFAVAAKDTPVLIGAQDCHAEPSGPFTGDLSAEMLKDAGASAVIVGHSERRAGHHESDAEVRGKVAAAWRAGLTAILCVGETKAERLDGRTLTVVGTQLDGSVPDGATAQNLVVAYEPVWAIGTGLTPTNADIAEIHAAIRGRIPAGTRILYGGSVNPKNAPGILALPEVDGALVGGASLKAEDFWAIARAAR